MSASDEKKPAASAAKANENENDELSSEQLDGVAGGAIIEPIITRREVRGGGGHRKPGGIPPSPTTSFRKPKRHKSGPLK